MARESNQDRPDFYQWREGPFEFTTNQQILNNRPSTSILEEEIQKKRDAERKLSFAMEIIYRSGRKLEVAPSVKTNLWSKEGKCESLITRLFVSEYYLSEWVLPPSMPSYGQLCPKPR